MDSQETRVATVGGRRLPVEPGQRFGSLVTISLVKDGRWIKWLCQCDCGRTHTTIASQLVHLKTVSCGCRRRIPWAERPPIERSTVQLKDLETGRAWHDPTPEEIQERCAAIREEWSAEEAELRWANQRDRTQRWVLPVAKLGVPHVRASDVT